MKVGAIKLASFLEGRKIRPLHLSLGLGVAPSTVHRILSGANVPVIKTARAIEEFTEGFVKMDDWLVEAKKARKPNA